MGSSPLKVRLRFLFSPISLRLVDNLVTYQVPYSPLFEPLPSLFNPFNLFIERCYDLKEWYLSAQIHTLAYFSRRRVVASCGGNYLRHLCLHRAINLT